MTEQLSPKNLEIPMPSGRAGKHPIESWRAGAISVSIWENDGTGNDGLPTKFRTASFERRYKDKSGEWKSANNLRLHDLPKAALLLNKAYEYLLLGAKEDDDG